MSEQQQGKKVYNSQTVKAAAKKFMLSRFNLAERKPIRKKPGRLPRKEAPPPDLTTLGQETQDG